MPPAPPLPPATDRDRCVSCGYDARSLAFVHDMATCPECGWGIDRTVLAELPRIKRPFITALAPALVLCALYVWSRGYRAFLDANLLLKVVIHGVIPCFLPPLAFLARNQLRWRLMPRGRRRLVLEGILFWLLCSAVIAVLALNWTYVASQLRQFIGLP